MFVVLSIGSMLTCFFEAYGTDPEAEKAQMAEFAEIMKRDNYKTVTTEFALAWSLLTMRCAKAKKFAEEVMGATLALKSKLLPSEENRVSLIQLFPSFRQLLSNLHAGNGPRHGVVQTMRWP